MEVLSESTPITIGLALTIIGGVIWLTKLHMNVVALTKKVNEMDGLQKEGTRASQEMREMIVEIKTILMRLVDDVKKNNDV